MSRNPWWYADLPPGWTESRVASLATLVNGYPFDSSLFDADEGFPLIRIRDLNRRETETRYNGPFVDSVSVSPSDLLIGMDGDFNVGRWLGDEPALLNQRACLLRGNALMVRYLEYALPIPLKQINDLTYATTVKHLSSGQILHTWIPVPDDVRPLIEFLDRETAQIDAMIDAQQRLVDLLEERQAVVQWQTILGQPNRPDQFDSWFGAPPSHWVVDKLGRHARVLNGSTPSRENLDYWSSNGDGHLWLNSSYANADRVFDGDQYVTDVAMQECHLPWLLPGTVLIAITGQGKTRGSVALLETESTINQHLAAIDANRQVWDPRYLTIMLRAAYDELRFISDEAGATKGALTCADLHDFVVPRPSLTEQQDLARAADIATANTRELVERAQDSIGLLRERRAAVITAAVTGRLDPRTGVERVEEMLEGASL